MVSGILEIRARLAFLRNYFLSIVLYSILTTQDAIILLWTFLGEGRKLGITSVFIVWKDIRLTIGTVGLVLSTRLCLNLLIPHSLLPALWATLFIIFVRWTWIRILIRALLHRQWHLTALDARKLVLLEPRFLVVLKFLRFWRVITILKVCEYRFEGIRCVPFFSRILLNWIVRIAQILWTVTFLRGKILVDTVEVYWWAWKSRLASASFQLFYFKLFIFVLFLFDGRFALSATEFTWLYFIVIVLVFLTDVRLFEALTLKLAWLPLALGNMFFWTFSGRSI